jgi:hypothetical protein
LTSWRRLRRLAFRSSGWLLRQAEKYASLLFVAIATLIVCVYVLLYLPSDLLGAGVNVLVFFMLMLVGGLLVAVGTPMLVRGHLWLRRRFEESTDIARDPPMLSQLLVSALLNVILMCVMVGLVPLSLLSASWSELAKALTQPETVSPWYLIWSLLFPGSAGPLVLYWIRTSRRRGGNPSTGARWLTVLQALCYLSWLLLLLWWRLPQVTARLGVWGIRENFWPFLFLTALPSTLISLFVIHQFEEAKKLDC